MPLPSTWTASRRRQFEHIKASLIAQGRTPEKAAEIAARTVNKHRREAGEVEPRRWRAVPRSGSS